MKVFLKILMVLSASIATTATAQAEIRELATFASGVIESETAVSTAAGTQTWVIFDIDNTLLHPTTMVGSHQWGDYMFAQRRALGGSEQEAGAFQHLAFGSVQSAVPVAITEPEIIEVIGRLKSKGVKIFALTARAESLYPQTLKQLAAVGIDLSDSAPAMDAHIHEGVVFAGGEPKGELLKRVIRDAAVKPVKVVFADDKRYNLESLETALASVHMPFVGLRYGFLDGEVAGFRSDLANTEWVEFKRTGRVVSDAEAAALIFSM